MNSGKTVITEEMVLNALKKVLDPELHSDIVTLGFIKNLAVSNGKVSFTIELTTPACPVRDTLRDEAHNAVSELPGVKEVDISMSAKVLPSRDERKQQMLPLVKNIIPVASGKGGVGKSTVSVNIALALSLTGAKVGLLDADIYGPSIPLMLGAFCEPEANENKKIIPSEKHKIKIMSMGFFLPQDQAVIWRGPMLAKMVEQFLSGVEWGELDYLIIDLPPGTGDVQLSLCQIIPLTGAVIVTTPQDIAVIVAKKAALMFSQLQTPILGVIENMSHYSCPQCGHKENLFGEGGGERTAKELNVPFLGSIPIIPAIQTRSDKGNPIVLYERNSDASKAFIEIAGKIAAQVSVLNFNRIGK